MDAHHVRAAVMVGKQGHSTSDVVVFAERPDRCDVLFYMEPMPG